MLSNLLRSPDSCFFFFLDLFLGLALLLISVQRTRIDENLPLSQKQSSKNRYSLELSIFFPLALKKYSLLWSEKLNVYMEKLNR